MTSDIVEMLEGLRSGAGDLTDEALKEAVEEIERLRSLLKEAGTWQPIETAPKDGTRILAKDRNGWREMWWVTNGVDYADYWQDEFDTEPEPTLWAPLPQPPSSKEGE